ncbi:MAG: hypothetical protein HLUCCA11_17855 [Phormidesmis priestleyi Ana]|uniref:Sulfotransferase domain-containing protein n=1 Tax=Phormidesmis priestleyi Ana TaxID=1666911 RepID=A0A0P7ZL41_9CYAN|nr:MAG: hypothetical protein HLUCCA11_17855 [Phormidesmis priestleyi Ana]
MNKFLKINGLELSTSVSREFIARKIKFKLRSYISVHPELFFPLVSLNRTGRNLAVCKSTDIVIEGFPRSANSFSVGAFQRVQDCDFSVAHHLHAPAQIIRASRLSIPSILLIRPPVDTVCSLRALDLQISLVEQRYNPALAISMNCYLKWWIDFYSSLLPYSDSYVISLFDETIQNFGKAINLLNLRFKTDFCSAFENISETEIKKVNESMGYHSGPSKCRTDFKLQVRKALESTDCQASIDAADSLYQKFVELSMKQNKF